jgi:hypothetical protein
MSWLPRATFKNADGTESSSVLGGLLLAPFAIAGGLIAAGVAAELEDMAFEMAGDLEKHQTGKCRSKCFICAQIRLGKVVKVTKADGSKLYFE